MAKLFCFSDCHGFFNELKQALDEAGFDPNNEEHYAVGLGDFVDRGTQPQEVINYLMSLDRCILVKGNHTDCLMDLIHRGYPLPHDWGNCTANTVLDLAPNATTWEQACAIAYGKVFDFVEKMVDYIELENHIMVHSWIPLESLDGLPKHYTKNRRFAFDPDWRNAPEEMWQEARWGNPFELAQQGFLPEKKIVFGHWSTSYMWAKEENRSEYGEDAKFEPYFGDGFIGLDCTTALSGKVGVVVLEDEFVDGEG